LIKIAASWLLGLMVTGAANTNGFVGVALASGTNLAALACISHH